MRFLKKLLHRRRLDRDLEDELRFHLEMSGNPHRFGNRTLIKETCRNLSANFFRMMRTEVLRGRPFNVRETDAVIVNEAFAREFFPGEDLIGKHLRVGPGTFTIVGIAANIQQDYRRPAEREPLVYKLYDAAPQRAMFLAARTRVPPSSLVFAQGLRPVALGLLVGLPAALGVGRVLRVALVGVSANDPGTFMGVTLTLVAACVLGCAIPARRAVRIDPIVALRCD
jgi:hypothetical protein